jgi:nicotinamidase-related amidase
MPASLEDSYAAGGFGRALAAGCRPALVIVDFVRAYLEADSPLYAAAEPARAGAEALLIGAREAVIPIVHTNVSYEAGGRNGGVFFRKVPALRCFEAGADPRLQQFAPGLEPGAGESVITKQYASAFFATPLASLLTAASVDTLLIAGVSTSGCVRATAVDACQHGFVPWVVREAVGDRHPGPHEASLFDLQAKYAEVVPLATALDYLRGVQCATSVRNNDEDLDEEGEPGTQGGVDRGGTHRRRR